MKKLFVTLAAAAALLFTPVVIQAACGCLKPPPEPAAVLPSVGIQGQTLSFFNVAIQSGDFFTVDFYAEDGSRYTATGTAALLGDIAAWPTQVSVPTLKVTMPVVDSADYGPMTVIGTKADGTTFRIEKDGFTAIGQPIDLNVNEANRRISDYATGVGEDGSLFIAFKGLEQICSGVEYEGQLIHYPLAYGYDQQTIWNVQGYLLDTFVPEHEAYYTWEAGTGHKSDRSKYNRHSFEQYCAAHAAGESLEVDPSNPDFHLNGVPHVQYDVVIVQTTGTFRDSGGTPAPGAVTIPEVEIKRN